jgi:hypothetical protein
MAGEMEEIEWFTLEELEFHETGAEEIVDPFEERMGIRCRDEEALSDFLEAFYTRLRGSTTDERLNIDFRGCKYSEDYMQRIVDGMNAFLSTGVDLGGRYWTDSELELRRGKLDFLKDKLGTEIEGEDLSEKLQNALALLKQISETMQKKFTLILDFRGIKITPSLLRPGKTFWWVFDAGMRDIASKLIWIMDDDPRSFDNLYRHYHMAKLFGPEGTDLYLVI